ncbi:MAG: hypothetical protein IPK82_12890 [Polyangiaceae bacterium]|nr:hypothetical protein [Polyangiaceae bacterium]
MMRADQKPPNFGLDLTSIDAAHSVVPPLCLLNRPQLSATLGAQKPRCINAAPTHLNRYTADHFSAKNGPP